MSKESFMSPQLTELLRLSLSERILLVEALWDSIAAENSEYKISDQELSMLQERYEEYKISPSKSLSWEEVKKNILGKL